MVERFIINSAQASISPNKDFLKSIETFCKVNNAKYLILPMQGKRIDEIDLHPDLYKYEIINGDFKLNNKIKIKDYKVKPQAIRPLTGLEALVKGDRSAIIAGTKINLRAVPNSNSRMAKLLMTTGAVTLPNYDLKHRIGKIAQTDHEYGAIIVEIFNDKKYHVRYIQALKNGKFQDLDTLYDGNKIKHNVRINTLVPGDIHTTEHDPNAIKATLNMVKDLRPRNIFLHDFFNGSSINHHHENDLIELHHYFGENQLSLENELIACTEMLKRFLDIIPKDAKIYIVQSNHNESLNRYLTEGRFINEPQNTELGCDLLKACFHGKNPLQEGMSYFMNIPKNVIFLERNDDVRIKGYYFNNHGDRGSNGSRGSPNTHDRTLEKSYTGHGHYVWKYRNTIKVGTNSYLQLRYNQGGTSNWSHTNGILYDIGTSQLVNIIDGHYRVK